MICRHYIGNGPDDIGDYIDYDDGSEDRETEYREAMAGAEEDETEDETEEEEEE